MKRILIGSIFALLALSAHAQSYDSGQVTQADVIDISRAQHFTQTCEAEVTYLLQQNVPQGYQRGQAAYAAYDVLNRSKPELCACIYLRSRIATNGQHTIPIADIAGIRSSCMTDAVGGGLDFRQKFRPSRLDRQYGHYDPIAGTSTEDILPSEVRGMMYPAITENWRDSGQCGSQAEVQSDGRLDRLGVAKVCNCAFLIGKGKMPNDGGASLVKECLVKYNNSLDTSNWKTAGR